MKIFVVYHNFISGNKELILLGYLIQACYHFCCAIYHIYFFLVHYLELDEFLISYKHAFKLSLLCSVSGKKNLYTKLALPAPHGSRASDYGLIKIDKAGKIIQFSEKPKGGDLETMVSDLSKAFFFHNLTGMCCKYLHEQLEFALKQCT